MKIVMLILLVAAWGPVSPSASRAQETIYETRAPQKPGTALTTTTEKEIRSPEGKLLGTESRTETMESTTTKSTYEYTGLPGKFTKGTGPRSRTRPEPDTEPRRRYAFEFVEAGVPPGRTDVEEACWFERQDGKLMLVDPVVTQKFRDKPR